MDLKTPAYLKAPPLFSSNKELELEVVEKNGLYPRKKETPFADDPLCKLNLKETSEFVKALPMTSTGNKSDESSRGHVENNKRFEAPPTPGRPVFSFSVARKGGFPSKWDDAEKWLINTSTNSCHDSKASHAKQNHVFYPKEADAFCDQPISPSNAAFAQLVPKLKDKFTDNVDLISPNCRYSDPTNENFLFRNTTYETMKDVSTEVIPQIQVQHRDVGTEMTPLASSTTSRCHTPFKSSSPARHNTPANRSGLLGNNGALDVSELHQFHFAKLDLEPGTRFHSLVSNWSSRQEEEEEISRSLRHFDMDSGCRPVNIAAESRASAWEEEEKTKSCIRYEREAARIQAWVNLQSAKAEAQSRKLEVKIQKMRANLEEKLLKRMAIINRKAEEMRTAAQQQHSQQIQRAAEQAQRTKNHHNSCISDHTFCLCFSCNHHI